MGHVLFIFIKWFGVFGSSGLFWCFFIGPNAVRTLPARLFAWAGRVRYAWRPAATRTGVRKAVAAARQPMRIDGAMSPIPLWKGGDSHGKQPNWPIKKHRNIPEEAKKEGTAKYAKYANPHLLRRKGSGVFAYFAYFAVQKIPWARIWGLLDGLTWFAVGGSNLQCPAKLRMEYPGAICHAVNRADRREDIFKDDLDRKAGSKRPGASCGRNSGGWVQDKSLRARLSRPACGERAGERGSRNLSCMRGAGEKRSWRRCAKGIR